MSLKFAYSNGRPTMTAKLSVGKNKARYFEFLVDSGADMTLISRSDAIVLGVNYDEIDVPEMKVEVANLSHIHTKKCLMTIEMDGEKFRIPVLVAKEEVERLLGRAGIFTRYEVVFRERAGEVEFRKI